ncbi:MAG: PEGA domain-containing protein, partial [Terriglobales bacterium]
FTIACAVDLRWSRCALLAVGEKFKARKEKAGIVVFYPDAKGKQRKQLYQLVASVPAPKSGAAADSGPASESPSPAEVMQAGVPESVKCNFSSTPSGADIIIDGRYVGSTPSEISLAPGTHKIVFTLSGFDQWKRKLTVGADSDVNVSASLQKVQP